MAELIALGTGKTLRMGPPSLVAPQLAIRRDAAKARGNARHAAALRDLVVVGWPPRAVRVGCCLKVKSGPPRKRGAGEDGRAPAAPRAPVAVPARGARHGGLQAANRSSNLGIGAKD